MAVSYGTISARMETYFCHLAIDNRRTQCLDRYTLLHTGRSTWHNGAGSHTISCICLVMFGTTSGRMDNYFGIWQLITKNHHALPETPGCIQAAIHGSVVLGLIPQAADGSIVWHHQR